MGWQRWRKSGPREPSDRVRKALAARFLLPPQALERLRCVERAGRHGGRPVRHLRIFDPALLPDGEKAVRAYDDLASHREALLFEGHTEGDGSICLTDRRPPRAAATGARGTPSPGP